MSSKRFFTSENDAEFYALGFNDANDNFHNSIDNLVKLVEKDEQMQEKIAENPLLFVHFIQDTLIEFHKPMVLNYTNKTLSNYVIHQKPKKSP